MLPFFCSGSTSLLDLAVVKRPRLRLRLHLHLHLRPEAVVGVLGALLALELEVEVVRYNLRRLLPRNSFPLPASC